MKKSRTARKLGTIHINRGAPRGRVAISEYLGRDGVDVGAFRAEVIVDHVEQHHDAACMGRLDECLQVFRPAIGAGRREGQHAVIAPVAVTRERADRHQFDSGDAERCQMIKLGEGSAKRTLGREGTDVEFVDDRLMPGSSSPSHVFPGIGAGVDNFARTVDAIRLPSRRRIGHAQAIRQNETVLRTRPRVFRQEFVPASLKRIQLASGEIVDEDADGRMLRGPKPEAHPSLHRGGAEGHLVTSFQNPAFVCWLSGSWNPKPLSNTFVPEGLAFWFIA